MKMKKWGNEEMSMRLKRRYIIYLLLLLPLAVQAQKVPVSYTFTVKGVRFKMNFVQGGTFMMGALPNDALADADEVRHKVRVYSYYIGETEVTQALWEAVMPKNRSKQKGPTVL